MTSLLRFFKTHPMREFLGTAKYVGVSKLPHVELIRMSIIRIIHQSIVRCYRLSSRWTNPGGLYRESTMTELLKRISTLMRFSQLYSA